LSASGLVPVAEEDGDEHPDHDSQSSVSVQGFHRLVIFYHCAWGPTPTRSRSAARFAALHSVASLGPQALSLVPCLVLPDDLLER
jgi:hypothetical protein